MRKYTVAAVLFLLAVGLMELRANEHSVPDIKQPKLLGKAAFGKLAYDKFCAPCHGQNIAGTDQGPSFMSPVYNSRHHPDRAFFIAATQGARAHHWQFGDMPPVDGVTEQQIGMIVEYVRAMQNENGLF